MKDKTIEFFEQKMRESRQRREKNSKHSSLLESFQRSFIQGQDISLGTAEKQQEQQNHLEILNNLEQNEHYLEKDKNFFTSPDKSKILELTIENDKSDDDSFSLSINNMFLDMNKNNLKKGLQLQQKEQEDEEIKEIPNNLIITKETSPTKEDKKNSESDKTEKLELAKKYTDEQILAQLKQNQKEQIKQLSLQIEQQPQEMQKQKLEHSKELGIISNIDEILKRQKQRLQFDLPISEMARHLNKPMDFATSKKEFSLEDPESAVKKILSRIQKIEPTQPALQNEGKFVSTINNSTQKKDKNNESIEKLSETLQSKLANFIDKTNEDKSIKFPDVKFINNVIETKAKENNEKDDYDEIINLIKNQQKQNEERQSRLNSSHKKSERKTQQVRVLSEQKELNEFKEQTPQKHQTYSKGELSPTSHLQLLKQERKDLQQQQNSIEGKKPKSYKNLKENIQQFKKVYNNSSSNKKSDFLESNKKSSESKQKNKFHEFLTISPVKKEENLSQYNENSNIKDNLSYSQSMDCSVFQEILRESHDQENFRTLEQIFEDDEVLQSLLQQAQTVQQEINELNDQIIIIEQQL